MQEASGRSHRGKYLPFREGFALLLHGLGFRPFGLLSLICVQDPKATPFELVALLLLALPLLFTFAKFVELDAIGERSHQFVAVAVVKIYSTKPMAALFRQVLVPLFVRLHERLQKAEFLLDQAHPLDDDVLLDGEHLVSGCYL